MNARSGGQAQPAPRGRERPARAFWFGVTLAVALFAALFPWFPGGRSLSEGALIDRTIVAPRDLTYESEVLTSRERQDHAKAVREVFVLDTDVRDRQLGRLDQILAAIDRVRGDQTLASSARESAIRAVPGVTVQTRSAAALAATPPEQWKALGDEARNALSRTLTQSIGQDDLEAARARAAGYFSSQLTTAQINALQELIAPLIVPSLVVDTERTQQLRAEAIANTPAVQVSFVRGQTVVPAGQRLSASDIEALDRLDLRRVGIEPHALFATVVFAALLGLATGGYVGVARPRALRGSRRLLLFSLLLVVPAAVAKFVLPFALPDIDRHFLVYALPFAAAPMIAVALLDVAASLLLAALLTAVVVYISVLLPAVDPGGEAAQLETARLALATLAASLAGIYLTARADRLRRSLPAALAAGGSVAAVLGLVWLLDPDRRAIDLAWIAGAGAVGGLLSGALAVGGFMLLGRPFGILTRVELMELTQLHHPLLRRLQDEAPGTFQHSILVGNMAERAADRIGADALLVRVGAYYHDVGKLVAPPFFIENLPAGETSPHEGLDPLQSTRVIHQHVTAGVELARKEGIPDAIARFIPEHHGTRLTTAFYRKAALTDPQLDEELFRYPGPRPRSRETALVMIADGCEATVRASPDRTPARVRAIVDETIKERIDEGQFDDCEISLRDLRLVAETYSATLTAVYHPRVEYPEPTERERARRGSGARRDGGVDGPGELRSPEPLAAVDGARRGRANGRDERGDGVDAPGPGRAPLRTARGAARELSEDDT